MQSIIFYKVKIKKKKTNQHKVEIQNQKQIGIIQLICHCPSFTPNIVSRR